MAQVSLWRRLGLPAIVALILLVVFVALFVVAALGYHPTLVVEGTLSANSYLDRVNALLANADVARGPELVAKYQCVVCHVNGANEVAPSFTGVAARAAVERPPLSAPAYLYESITNPTAFVVEKFAPVMPQNFADRIPDRDLGDIIAYLLTQ